MTRAAALYELRMARMQLNEYVRAVDGLTAGDILDDRVRNGLAHVARAIDILTTDGLKSGELEKGGDNVA